MSRERLPGAPRCPACGRLVDGYTPIDLSGVRPKHDDITVCLYCATPCAYVVTDVVALRRLTPAEHREALASLPELRKALRVARDASILRGIVMP